MGFAQISVASAQRSLIWQEKPGSWLLNTGVGLTRYAGDMNEWGDLAHLRLGTALNAAAAYRFTYRVSFRAEAQLYYIYGSQRYTRIDYNNLSFRSLNPDLWAGLQIDFRRVDDRYRFSIPYAFAGAGFTYMTPRAIYKGRSYNLASLRTEGVAYNRLPVIVRYGLGLPVLAGDGFKLHLEGAYTHVMSDYLDDVSTVYPSRKGMSELAAALSDRRPEKGGSPNSAGAQRGNSQKRDGYLTVSGRLIFVLSTKAQRNYRRSFGG
ncbi:hypothetical protein HNV11_21320 [Spirosoma taeanense]|uniref:Outer membrane protein beta-barrel domain-containing protein n=1 Tax=Spirosoma taeanense TaxID=2735870 RepID=A0A6M5YEJ9_9BACT|nr:hypothetical protein HNV11_21320 [Spirosoma taeanense]